MRKIHEDVERLPFVTKMFELFLDGTPVTGILKITNEEWHLKRLQRKKIGGKPMVLSEIYVILNNPFYCGKFEYPMGSGIWWKNNPSIKRAITEEQFNQVQIKFGNVSKYETKHNYTFAHLMKCGRCGSGIVVDGKYQVICTKCKTKFQITRKNSDTCTGCGTLISEMNNPKIIHYIYGRCGRKKDTNCRELSISEKEMERQIDKRLSEIELNHFF